jgi:hypothetical protein
VTLFGSTMLGEQAGPKQLVCDVALAEEAGFDFAVISDHSLPWLEVQGHSPYAWSVLGGAAQATDHLPLMTESPARSVAITRPWSPRRRRPCSCCRRGGSPSGWGGRFREAPHRPDRLVVRPR